MKTAVISGIPLIVDDVCSLTESQHQPNTIDNADFLGLISGMSGY
jgi:hypothetical protein